MSIKFEAKEVKDSTANDVVMKSKQMMKEGGDASEALHESGKQASSAEERKEASNASGGLSKITEGIDRKMNLSREKYGRIAKQLIQKLNSAMNVSFRYIDSSNSKNVIYAEGMLDKEYAMLMLIIYIKHASKHELASTERCILSSKDQSKTIGKPAGISMQELIKRAQRKQYDEHEDHAKEALLQSMTLKLSDDKKTQDFCNEIAAKHGVHAEQVASDGTCKFIGYRSDLVKLAMSDDFKLDQAKAEASIVEDSKDDGKKRYFTCCICGKLCEGYGNNPWPVCKEGECCDECNYDKVIPARIANIAKDSMSRHAKEDAIDTAYGLSELSDAIEKILDTHGASEDDSTDEGYFYGMTDKAVDDVFEACKKLVLSDAKLEPYKYKKDGMYKDALKKFGYDFGMVQVEDASIYALIAEPYDLASGKKADHANVQVELGSKDELERKSHYYDESWNGDPKRKYFWKFVVKARG